MARLAGLPLEVLLRAEAILAELETAAAQAPERQLSLLPLVSEQPREDGRTGKLLDELKDCLLYTSLAGGSAFMLSSLKR